MTEDTQLPLVFSYAVEDYGTHEVSMVEARSPEEAVAKWTHDSICEGLNRDMAVIEGRIYTSGPVRSLYWVSCDSEEIPDTEVWVETPVGFAEPPRDEEA